MSNLVITNEHNKTVAGKEVVPLYGVSTSSEPIKCPGQIEREREREQGGGGKGLLQGDDVDEATISPSKCNKEEERTVSLQIDKFNVLVYLYGNAATQAFTRPPLLLLSLS